MQDYLRQKIAQWKDGVPFDEHNFALDKTEMYDENRDLTDDPTKAVEAREATNPYGSLHFAVGSGDDFWCFDYADLGDNRIAVHAVINSETGSFIETIFYGILSKRRAAYELRDLVDRAITWTYENNVRHSKKGWNQDPWYVLRSYLAGMKATPYRNYTANQLRFGKGKDDRIFVDIPFPCPKCKPEKGTRKRKRNWQAKFRNWIGASDRGLLIVGLRRRGRGAWIVPQDAPESVRQYFGCSEPDERGRVFSQDFKTLEELKAAVPTQEVDELTLAVLCEVDELY